MVSISVRLVGASGVSPPACGPRGCLSFPCARLSAPVMRPRCGTVVLCATRCVCCVEAGDLCRTEASRSRESWRVRPLVSGPGLAQTSCQRWLRPRSSQASPHRGCAGRGLLCCCAHEYGAMHLCVAAVRTSEAHNVVKPRDEHSQTCGP